MSTNIACPNCRLMLQLPDEFQGQKVRCPKCDTAFVADARTSVTAQAPPPLPRRHEVEAGPPPASPPPGRASRRLQEEYFDDDYSLDRVSLGSDFRPGGGLATAVMVLLGLNIFVGVLMLGSDVLQLTLANRLLAGDFAAQVDLENSDILVGLVALLYLAALISCGVVYLVWFHRVHANLPALGARDLTYTSGWAVGAWFVPFLNLVRPVQIAQEIWQNSDPAAVDGDVIRPTTSGSVLVGFWWAFWIIFNVMSNFAFRSSAEIKSPEELKISSVLGIVAGITAMIAAALAIGVVWSINSRQTARADALAGR